MLVEGTLNEEICDQGIDLCSGETKTDPAEALHQWAEDEQLLKAKRLLRPLPVRSAPISGASKQQEPRLRFDPPTSDSLKVPLPKAEARRQPADTNPLPARSNYPVYAAPVDPTPSTGLLAGCGWAMVSLGLMGMVCGGVLMGWSLSTGRAQLWDWGLPIALVGQGGLLVGLLFAVIGRSSSQKQTPQRVGAPHPQGLPLGYHAGADVHAPTMLAELRGQLEILSAQLASQDQAASRPWY